MLDVQICEQARLSRDARFDGKFFTAVLTTGIFCRPVCPARAPKPENVRYYDNAMQAQQAGFQPCKRCYPELAPVTQLPLIIKQLLNAFEAGETASSIAAQFQLSERQIRRLFIKHLGLPVSQYLHHKRLLLARKLLKNTSLTITEVCFAAGFKSLRRFNEVIKLAYHGTPSELRKAAEKHPGTDQVSVYLHYRPPFDWPLMLSFFRARQLACVEQVDEHCYRRSISINGCHGWFSVTHSTNKAALKLTVKLDDYRELNQVIQRVRSMFDLDADMNTIHQHLSSNALLATVIATYPGLRLPGCWDIFEFSIRAILGQQISVKAATTLANRIALHYGKPCVDNPYQLTHVFPEPEALVASDYDGIGLTRSRISTLNNWLEFYQTDRQLLSCYTSVQALEKTLISIKGIGPWTANYLAMRGLSDPDAFPSADLGIIKALTVNDAKPDNKAILAMAQAWRPWRAYAAIYLWHSLSTSI